MTVNVTPDRVRSRIKVQDVDANKLDDAIVDTFIDDATAEVEDETGETINHASCSGLEAAAITNLAALYCYGYLKSGSPANVTYSAPGVVATQSLDPTIKILQDAYKRALGRLSNPAFKVAESVVNDSDSLWE